MFETGFDHLTPAADGTLFANDEWQVLGDGLEHRATGYFIERDAVGSRRGDGLWSWPMQLAEKSWCSPLRFREAFLTALDLFGIDRDEALSRSFAAGFGLRAGPSHTDGFVALGDLIRPRTAERKRPTPSEARAAVPAHRPRPRVSAGIGA